MKIDRILVIDDEEVIQMVIQECLQAFTQWEIVIANSGREGIEIARSHSPDAILLDMSMPGMDGIETYHRLQQDPDSQRIPVILLTAKVQPDDLAQFATLPLAGILTKPFDPMTLATQINEILDRHYLNISS
jgi:CheY-like chemotaxis protein